MTDQDDAHLDLLGTLHYVLAGLTALVGLFPVIHLVLGILMVSGVIHPKPSAGHEAEEMRRVMGWLFIGAGSAIIVAFLTLAACLALAGQRLRARRKYSYCFVMAAISCAFAPLGTALGVFTILVLLRPGVKARFDAPQPGASPPTIDALT